jgi:hypothetical protein
VPGRALSGCANLRLQGGTDRRHRRRSLQGHRRPRRQPADQDYQYRRADDRTDAVIHAASHSKGACRSPLFTSFNAKIRAFPNTSVVSA